jgi:hypothetical protein
MGFDQHGQITVNFAVPTIKRYTTRPEVVEAAEVTESNRDELAKWCGGMVWNNPKPSDPTDVAMGVTVPHIASAFVVPVGEYLVKDIETGRFRKYTKQEFSKFSEVGLRQDGLTRGGSIQPMPDPYTTNSDPTDVIPRDFHSGSGESYGHYADPRFQMQHDVLDMS